VQRVFREHGLSIALFGLFLFSIFGQSIAGLQEYNEEQQEHGEARIGYFPYLASGHFLEAVFENWESEFLQMGSYVVLTIFLRQRGSAESKPMEGQEAVDGDPRRSREDPNAPWPVRRGGLALKVYENSLTFALFLLFFVSFALHAAAGAREYSQEQVQHGQQEVSMAEYLTTSRLWFESFQNWQSEFLSIGVLVVLSVFLRQRGSPESKPVHVPHGQTGHQ
jgi:hypothetical protein